MSSPFRIREVRTFTATSDISQRIADATHDISDINIVVVEIELANGTRGQGYLLAFHYFPRTIIAAFKDATDFFTQFDAFETVRMAEAFRAESEYFGNEGLLQWAHATVNIAMWDAWAKSQELPIWQMLGVNRRRVPVYGSGGWLSYSDRELIDEVVGYQRQTGIYGG